MKKKTVKKLYWSRKPGKFVNKNSGIQPAGAEKLKFNGTAREWYETLVETIIDARNQAKITAENTTLVVSPDVNCILGCSVLAKLDARGMLLSGMSVKVSDTQPRCVITVINGSGEHAAEVCVTDMDVGSDKND